MKGKLDGNTILISKAQEKLDSRPERGPKKGPDSPGTLAFMWAAFEISYVFVTDLATLISKETKYFVGETRKYAYL